MIRRGKCSNYANCLLAYRNETISVTEGDFVCPECRQPLTPLAAAEKPSFKPMPLILGAGGVLVVGLIVFMVITYFSTTSRMRRSEPKSTEAEPSPTSSNVAMPNESPGRVESASIGSAPTAEPAPSDLAPKAVQPDFDSKKEENRTVKAEVLKRIDLMPNISAENKDKLYVSVERARQMGKVITIPFSSGKIALSPADVENLRREVQSPQIQQLMGDPTAVFVILGYADRKGDEKANLRISQERADAALKALREKCGVINVMHAVGMGGSTLFDSSGTEKNRVAEVFAVLP